MSAVREDRTPGRTVVLRVQFADGIGTPEDEENIGPTLVAAGATVWEEPDGRVCARLPAPYETLVIRSMPQGERATLSLALSVRLVSALRYFRGLGK